MEKPQGDLMLILVAFLDLVGASHFRKNISLGWQNSRLALPV
ncbi:hypothetical protein POG22_02900 [Geitlerinema sp. CS-897]|nr:hypothetical protein [Geitlerinema sp. CS-897]